MLRELGARTVDEQATDARIDGVATDARIDGVATDARIDGVATDARIDSVASGGRIDGVATDARIDGVATDARIDGVATDARIDGVATDARIDSVASGGRTGSSELRTAASEPQPVDGEPSDDRTRAADATTVASEPRTLETCQVAPSDDLAGPSSTWGGRPESITVGELVDKAAHSGFGFLVAVLSLVAIPFFGLSTPFGLAIALVGFQLLIGRTRPWLPRRARTRPLKMTMLDRILSMVNRRMRWLAASTRRRWQPLVTPRLVGFGIVLLGLGLALPLPIPGSNLIFIVPLLVYAIGLLEGDGLWIVVAHLATLVDLALLVIFGATVLTVLSSVWAYLF
jgi:hypothetical protein